MSGSRRRRIRRQARGARSPRASARASAGPGRRGSPEIRNVSSSKPASGTSRASTRSGDPAKVVVTPCSASASATASDGSTWPAVPPAAIRHLSLRSSAMPCDVKENAHRGERDDEARAAVRDERKRDSGQRSEADDGREVDQRLPADEGRQAGREPLAEGVAGTKRDAQAGVGEDRVCGDHEARAEQAELLADDREDHVRVRLREVVHLADALTEPDAENPARAEPDQRLHRLETGSLGVVPGIDEAEEARAPVRLEPDRRERERSRDRPPTGEHAQRRAGDEQDRAEHYRDRDHRPQVRLGEDERTEGAGDQADRLDELAEATGRGPAGEIGGGPDRERELGELRRLEGERVDRLPFEVEAGIAAAERGRGRRRAVDHHEPEGGQAERDEDEDVGVELPLPHRATPLTIRRKASPRSSKSRNWS